MPRATARTVEPDDPRRAALLEAALAVFARYGFRKTSMDEVARAAELSRQALYLRFRTKEDLFRATVTHVTGQALGDATRALRDDDAPLPQRLVAAFDAWSGRFVELMQGPSDLGDVAATLVGGLVAEHEQRFVDELARAIRSSGLAAAHQRSGVNARQLAETLQATARGLKHRSPTRATFVEGVGIAVRALCTPITKAK